MVSERETLNEDEGDSSRIVETADSGSRIGYKNPAGNTSASTADLNATGENVDSDAEETDVDSDEEDTDDDFGNDDNLAGANR